MRLIGVVAMDVNGCIGKDGKLPWHYKEDLQYFRKLTLDSTVIMGRKTWDSLPKRPLDKRNNIIITRNPPNTHSFSDTVFVNENSLKNVLFKLKEPHYVIGGEQIYNLLWYQITEFIVTHVKTKVENGDAFISMKFWNEFKEINNIELSENCKVIKYIRGI